jgi:hypothetical protein
MRVYGRNYNTDGTYVWEEISTDANGYNDGVYLTAFCQVLQLQTGESPFYADYGIPSRNSVMQQVFPDYNVYLMQQRYASYFALLKVQKVSEAVNRYGSPTPVYNVNAITQAGSIVSVEIPT